MAGLRLPGHKPIDLDRSGYRQFLAVRRVLAVFLS